MVAGYTPGVPVLGTVSTIGAAILLLGGYGLIVLRRRRAAEIARSKGGTPMSASLKGKSVVVTGGSKGIGKGIASVFARHGAKVLIVARHLKDAEATAQELTKAGGTASAFAADVTKLADMEAMAKTAVDRHGGHRRAVRQCRHLPAGEDRGHDARDNGTRWWTPTSRAPSSR